MSPEAMKREELRLLQKQLELLKERNRLLKEQNYILKRLAGEPVSSPEEEFNRLVSGEENEDGGE